MNLRPCISNSMTPPAVSLTGQGTLDRSAATSFSPRPRKRLTLNSACAGSSAASARAERPIKIVPSSLK